MIPDPTSEIRRIRHELGAEDGFDLDRIFARTQRLQAELGYECVRRPPRKPTHHTATHLKGEAVRSEAENFSPPPNDR